MNIIDDIKRKRKWVDGDKGCFTMLEMCELTGEKDPTIYRMVQEGLASGEWEFAGFKRNKRGYPVKAYRLKKK